MILLGIDPGFADMGYGVIATDGAKDRVIAYGSLKTSPKDPTEVRLARVYEGLAEIIATHKPEHVAIEKLYFSKNVKTALQVAEARGVIRVCIERHGLPCAEFNPSDVKIAVCGHGAAAKDEVQKMVKMLLGLKEVPQPDDAADALALALTLSHTRATLARLGRAR
jgi:crossover junction endodeoxyribonuclease RuvC